MGLLKYVRVALAVVVGAVGLLFVAFVGHLLIVVGMFDSMPRSPYEAENICFKRDFPGATARHVQFTPVQCKAPQEPLGDPVGADLASLSFKDLDNDGLPEAIVESSFYRCKFGGKGCYEAYRVVMKVCPDCEKQVVVVQRLFLEDRYIGQVRSF